MEYYDSIHNSKLYNHYNQKNINLLTDEDVITLLDKHGDLDTSTVKIFDEDPYQLVERETRFYTEENEKVKSRSLNSPFKRTTKHVFKDRNSTLTCYERVVNYN
jgi:hypothetical protein